MGAMASDAPVSGRKSSFAWAKGLPAFSAFALPGVALVSFALVRIGAFLHTVSVQTPSVTLQPRDAIALTIGTSFLGFAALTLLPRSAEQRRSRWAASSDAARIDWTTICLGIVVAGIALSAVAPWIAAMAAKAIVAKHGYTACVSPADERRSPLRWVRPMTSSPDRCPRTWREAHI